MATNTTNLGLRKPAATDNVDVAQDLSANFDKIDALVYEGVFRQAIINGNFDIWQRGTSFSPSSTAPVYTADRWVLDTAAAATNYTVTRQDGTAVNGSQYCLRYARNTGATNTDGRAIRQGIETANSILIRGKKLTLSFYARCGANYSPTSSLLNALIQTGTGTNERPDVYTGGATVATLSATLTTSWQKFNITTSNVIANTVNEINITFYDTPTGTAGVADYYEIAQVQPCAGDVALPFQPKSFAEELIACQRYYYSLPHESPSCRMGQGLAILATRADILVPLKVPMRTLPAFVSAANANLVLSDGGLATDITDLAISTLTSGSLQVCLVATVASGLTSFRPYFLEWKNAANMAEYVAFSAEL